MSTQWFLHAVPARARCAWTKGLAGRIRRARHGVFAKCVDARPAAFRGGRLLPNGAGRSL